MIAPTGSWVSTSISSVTASITSIVIAAGKMFWTRMVTTGSVREWGRRSLGKAIVARRRLTGASVPRHPSAFVDPHRQVGGLQRGLHRAGQLGAGRAQPEGDLQSGYGLGDDLA